MSPCVWVPQVLVNQLRSFGRNIARQRRKMDILLGDWQYLQEQVRRVRAGHALAV